MTSQFLPIALSMKFCHVTQIALWIWSCDQILVTVAFRLFALLLILNWVKVKLWLKNKIALKKPSSFYLCYSNFG